MRILIAGGDNFDSAEYSSKRALQRMGHHVETWHFRNALAPWPISSSRIARQVWSVFLKATIREDRGRIQRELIRAAETMKPDLVLIFPVNLILRDTVGEIKKRTGAKVAAWFQDAIVNFGRADFLGADFDVLCFKDPWIVEKIGTALSDPRVRHLPQCCDPNLHRPIPLTDADRKRFECDVAIYGNLYPYRAAMLESVVDLDLRIYGALQGWEREEVRLKHVGFPVFGDDKARAMLAARVVANTNHYAEIMAPNKRTFELAGIGAFQVTDAPAVEQYFRPDEVVTFKGKKDLREKVLHYLHEPEERLEISRRAVVRAHAEHTFDRRMMTLLEMLGSPAPSLPREEV